MTHKLSNEQLTELDNFLNKMIRAHRLAEEGVPGDRICRVTATCQALRSITEFDRTYLAVFLAVAIERLSGIEKP